MDRTGGQTPSCGAIHSMLPYMLASLAQHPHATVPCNSLSPHVQGSPSKPSTPTGGDTAEAIQKKNSLKEKRLLAASMSAHLTEQQRKAAADLLADGFDSDEDMAWPIKLHSRRPCAPEEVELEEGSVPVR